MVIQTEEAISLYCPICGNLHVEYINGLFSQNEQRYSLYCDCGQMLGTVSVMGKELYKIEILCAVCHEHHSFFLQRPRTHNRQLRTVTILCPSCGIETGLFGQRQDVEDKANRLWEEKQNMPHQPDIPDNPALMLGMYNLIHDMVVRGDLCCPRHQSLVHVQIQEGEILLICPECGRTLTLPARTTADLRALEIPLQQQTERHAFQKIT